MIIWCTILADNKSFPTLKFRSPKLEFFPGEVLGPSHWREMITLSISTPTGEKFSIKSIAA